MTISRKWTHWYLLVMLGVFPLWVGWSGYANLTAQKFGFFAAATCVWLAGLAVFAVREGKQSISLSSGRLWVMAFMAGLCLSALLSPYGIVTLIGSSRYDGLFTWLLYGCIFLGVSAYGAPRMSYAYALAGSGAVNCVIAIVQLMGNNALWLFPNNRTFYDAGVYYTGEFLGLIGNTDLLAAFFCLTIPVCFGAYLLFGGRKTAVLLPSGALCLFVLLESGVSGGVVGLILCVLVGAPLVVTDRERFARALTVLALLLAVTALSVGLVFSENGVEIKLCKLMIFLLVPAVFVVFCGNLLRKADIKLCKLQGILLILEILCVASALVWIYAIPPESGTLYELSRLLHGEVLDTFGSNRVTIWKDVWNLIRERPLLGGGPGTLKLRSGVEFSRFVEESGRTLRVHVDNAHNEYLHLWVNGGAVSLLPYLMLMGATVRRFWKYRNRRIACALLLPLLAWWGEALFGLGLCIVLPMMWIVWGMFWTVDDNNFM